MRILIVDDDTAVRERAYDALTPKGHQVLAASSGPQLFELLKTQRADLILLDLSMPKTPGTELTKKLRTLDDAVPIVLLRGAQDAEPSPDDQECIRYQEVLAKEPPEAFMAAIERTAFSLQLLQQNARLLKQLQQRRFYGQGEGPPTEDSPS